MGSNRLDLGRVEKIGLLPGELDRIRLEVGDLLIVEGNGSIDQIGRSCLWDGSIEPCVHQNHLIKVRFETQDIASWVQTWLQSPHGRRELEEKASSTSGLHTLSISKVGQLRVPIPPLSELGVAQRLREVGSSHHEEAIRSLDDEQGRASILRQSILTAAFRGELIA